MAGTSTVTPEKDQLGSAQTTQQTYPVQGRMMSSRKTRPRDEVGHYVCPNCGSPSLCVSYKAGASTIWADIVADFVSGSGLPTAHHSSLDGICLRSLR